MEVDRFGVVSDNTEKEKLNQFSCSAKLAIGWVVLGASFYYIVSMQNKFVSAHN